MTTQLLSELTCQSCFAALPVKTQDGGIITCEYCGTEHALSEEVRTVKVVDSYKFRSALVWALQEAFSSFDDLNELIIVLSSEVPYYRLDSDDIAGSAANHKARNLVSWCMRRGCLQPLVDVAFALRPCMDLRWKS